jgi:hypothetical protein
MRPLQLSDEQMDALVRIAAPLIPSDRRLFLEDVARALNGREIGPGLLHRVAVECQRKYWSPNALDGKAHGGKYR